MLELTAAQKVVLALAVVMLGGSGAYLFSARSSAPALPPQQLYQQPAAGPDSVELVVQVTGEVNRPGMYRVAPGMRVYELVGLAGGFTQHADQEAVNLAQPVEDGQKVAVPRLPEPKPSTQAPERPIPPGQQPSSVPSPTATVPPSDIIKPSPPPPNQPHIVDLNTATQADLERVPGVGPVLATRIIAYRQYYGPFKTVYQLRLIKGVGQQTFDKIKPYVTVAPASPPTR